MRPTKRHGSMERPHAQNGDTNGGVEFALQNGGGGVVGGGDGGVGGGGGGGGVARKKVARRRWAILAKALKSPTGSEPSSPTDEYSVRRISSFMLLTTQQIAVDAQRPLACGATTTIDPGVLVQIKKRTWYRYTMTVGARDYFVVVGHRMRTFSAEDLMGFNNTGNVCIWPSEETLTYYLGANLHLVRGRRVLELGGGMSCLAGLVAAKYGDAHSVHLTDGNKASVENVVVSLACNEFTCPVDSAVLKWGRDAHTPPPRDAYDLILCADCLFFDDARADLIVTLWECLAAEGVALVMAPRRGGTLAAFIAQCRARGFRCVEVINYNRTVWEKHLLLLANCDYDDNIHYPILLELTKAADYWKSNAKKYCDFCKCWITDNKPSVEFHEKGKRHQENVAKRLKQITRNNTKLERDGAKMDAAMAKMEAEAIKAYRKDVENNADFTSHAINKRLQDENLELAGGSGGQAKKVWREVKSDKGVYYWNTMTNESAWEPPKEGYLTLKEVKEIEELENSKVWKEYNKKVISHTRLQAQEDKKDADEARAKLAREKLKERRVEPVPVIEAAPILESGKTNPYGRWQTVQIIEQEPEPATVEEIPLPDNTENVETPPPRKEFKEKTVEALSDVGGSTQFKKRKLKGGNQRNTRTRTDDD